MNTSKLVIMYLAFAMFFVSCDYKKDAEPSARYLSQQHTVRLRSLPVNTEFEYAYPLPGGATNGIKDSIYKMSMTWAQGWHADSTLTKVEFIGCITLMLILFYLGYLFWKNQKDSNSKGFLLFFAAGLICGMLASASVDWYHTYEKEIKKIDYVHYMATDGSLQKWWPLPAENY